MELQEARSEPHLNKAVLSVFFLLYAWGVCVYKPENKPDIGLWITAISTDSRNPDDFILYRHLECRRIVQSKKCSLLGFFRTLEVDVAARVGGMGFFRNGQWTDCK